MSPLAAKTIPIRARATGTLGTIKEGFGREEERVGIEVAKTEVVEDEAIQVIGAEISHMTMETRSKRTIQRINY